MQESASVQPGYHTFTTRTACGTLSSNKGGFPHLPFISPSRDWGEPIIIGYIIIERGSHLRCFVIFIVKYTDCKENRPFRADVGIRPYGVTTSSKRGCRGRRLHRPALEQSLHRRSAVPLPLHKGGLQGRCGVVGAATLPPAQEKHPHRLVWVFCITNKVVRSS